MYDIDTIRLIIYDQLVNRLKGRGETVITKKDVEWTFYKYDELVFYNQIQERVKEVNGEMVFNITTKSSTCICKTEDTNSIDSRKTYYFIVSSEALHKIRRIDSSFNRIIGTMLIIEHQIIHLLMLLYGYGNRNKLPRRIYSKHGELFRCMLKTFFGESNYRHDLGAISEKTKNKVDIHSQVIERKSRGYIWWDNSCYIDSLLVILLLSDYSSYIRKCIFETNVKEIKYSPTICQEGSKIDTTEKIRELSSTFQMYLKSDYERMNGGESIKCNDIRSLLYRCYPRMKRSGRWTVYSAPDIYGLIVDLFPSLATYFTPVIVKGENGNEYKTIDIDSHSTFNTNEYHDGAINTIGKNYIWKEINTPLLVFQEGGMVMNNNRPKFQEYIIDNRYRLFGSIVLLGKFDAQNKGTTKTLQTGSYGVHYISYVRIGNIWYEYNDMGPTISPLKELPKRALQRETISLPELLFYERVEEYIPKENTNTLSNNKIIDDKLDYIIVPKNGTVSLFALDKFKMYDKELKNYGGKLLKSSKDNIYLWNLNKEEVSPLVSKIRKLYE